MLGTVSRVLEGNIQRLTTGMLLAATAGVPFDKAGVVDDCGWGT
jgi:hypothetical protein